MSGTFSILERYFPTHKYDYETKTFGPNLNFFSDLMAKQAELAKEGGSTNGISYVSVLVL